MSKSKRMINCSFVNASSFKLKTSNRAKLLYFYIISNSDDKGFCDNVDEICELLNSNDRNFNNISNDLFQSDYEAALQELLDKNLIFKLLDNHKNSIYLIRHWYLHNNIPERRINDSSYDKYLNQFTINDNKEYQLIGKINNENNNDINLYDKCNTNDNQVCEQIKLNKSKLNESKLNNNKKINNNDCESDDSDFDENEIYEIPKSNGWSIDKVSKAVYLNARKRSGEKLTEKQELYLKSYLEAERNYKE